MAWVNPYFENDSTDTKATFTEYKHDFIYISMIPDRPTLRGGKYLNSNVNRA